jgi:hypothetical protein
MNVEYCLAWLRARLDIARGIPADTLLLIVAAAIAILALALVAWVSARRRNHTLKLENAGLAADLASSRKALDAERRWRLAAEKIVALAAKPAVEIEPAPLYLGPDLTATAKDRVQRQYIDAVRGPDQSRVSDRNPPQTPPAAFLSDDQKAKPGRPKTPRRAARVDDLINRTIIE